MRHPDFRTQQQDRSVSFYLQRSEAQSEDSHQKRLIRYGLVIHLREALLLKIGNDALTDQIRRLDDV